MRNLEQMTDGSEWGGAKKHHCVNAALSDFAVVCLGHSSQLSDTRSVSGMWLGFGKNFPFIQETKTLVSSAIRHNFNHISDGFQMCLPHFRHRSFFYGLLLGQLFARRFVSADAVPQTAPLPLITFIIMSWTYPRTSSLWSSRWISQVTAACGERGTHSRKVLLFSVPYTTLSSVTSRPFAKRGRKEEKCCRNKNKKHFTNKNSLQTATS